MSIVHIFCLQLAFSMPAITWGGQIVTIAPHLVLLNMLWNGTCCFQNPLQSASGQSAASLYADGNHFRGWSL